MPWVPRAVLDLLRAQLDAKDGQLAAKDELIARRERRVEELEAQVDSMHRQGFAVASPPVHSADGPALRRVRIPANVQYLLDGLDHDQEAVANYTSRVEGWLLEGRDEHWIAEHLFDR